MQNKKEYVKQNKKVSDTIQNVLFILVTENRKQVVLIPVS